MLFWDCHRSANVLEMRHVKNPSCSELADFPEEQQCWGEKTVSGKLSVHDNGGAKTWKEKKIDELF
jgi:hypothetical protein